MLQLQLQLSACSSASQAPRAIGTTPSTSGPQKGPLPSPPASSANLPADDGQWLMAAKDYANTRFSGLTQITTANVSKLQPAWSFSTGVLRGQEAAPIVVNGTMYIVTPYPNIVYALDLTKPGAPVKWKFNPKPAAAAQGVACCDTVNRGAVYSERQDHLQHARQPHDRARRGYRQAALEYDSRRHQSRRNDHDVADRRQGQSACRQQRRRVRGSGLGYGAETNRRLDGVARVPHRARQGRTHRAEFQALLSGSSRQGSRRHVVAAGSMEDRRRHGVGMDLVRPSLDLIYYGTANPGPWNAELRPGDNKWACTVFARRPETGEAIWAYQYNPHDLFDHDSINEHLVLDLQINGQMRKVLVHPERNGNMYVIDRQTGEVLSAEPFAYTNTSDGVDLRTGRLKPVEAKEPKAGKVIRNICPAGARRKGLAADRVLAENRSRLHPAPESLSGHGRHRGQLHRRERRTSARTSRCTPAPAATAASSALGIRSTRRKSGR